MGWSSVEFPPTIIGGAENASCACPRRRPWAHLGTAPESEMSEGWRFSRCENRRRERRRNASIFEVVLARLFRPLLRRRSFRSAKTPTASGGSVEMRPPAVTPDPPCTGFALYRRLSSRRKNGWNAFHCVPDTVPGDGDAVERVPTLFKGSKRETGFNPKTGFGFRFSRQDAETQSLSTFCCAAASVHRVLRQSFAPLRLGVLASWRESNFGVRVQRQE